MIDYTGMFEITINGKTQIIKNRIMDNVIDTLISTLLGLSSVDLELKYLALGTGNATVTGQETKLQNEIFRTQFQEVSKTGLGELTSLAIITENEAVTSPNFIEEIGIFGGAGATSVKDSGTLIARVLWKHEKTGFEEIQFKRIDRIRRT